MNILPRLPNNIFGGQASGRRDASWGAGENSDFRRVKAFVQRGIKV